MTSLKLAITSLLIIYCSKGLNFEIRPIDFFEKISDRTAEAYKTLPSINLTPNDGRIDKLSEGTDFPYSVTFSEKDEAFIVIVNPNITVGYLWWKKPKKLILLQSRTIV